MILEALELTARDIGLALLPSLLFVAFIVGIGWLEARAERRHLAAIDRERARVRANLQAHERRRSEMRSYNARATSDERWGGLV